ncbi:unnamed protein product [Strongylus vulgaris]|uniref:Uncharacterized protein n=1 Tax=Strongylus vulgaris TaxID=40348 RepID=A0A3P7JBT6_STRVU|nr:unnamed protein product [Strongylus vulgaris]
MVADWSLPIFEIAEKHRETVLSRVSNLSTLILLRQLISGTSITSGNCRNE